MALDKTNGYHFVYYNRVIKPALVGLCGPWISGGIEFNWPQHHRPSTFEPLDWTIETHHDGAATVWFAELERMVRTRGRHGFTLYPDRAFLEVRVDREPDRRAADVPLVGQPGGACPRRVPVGLPTRRPRRHGPRQAGRLRLPDRDRDVLPGHQRSAPPGTDISRYSTIRSAQTSYMAYHSDYDFLGCYDDRACAGLLHVADHHVVPGKKQWTWGNGELGWAWDRQLTDEDGPYIELMCGASPTTSPISPGSCPARRRRSPSTFSFKEMGPPKNASREVAVNLAMAGNECGGSLWTRPLPGGPDPFETRGSSAARYDREALSAGRSPTPVRSRCPRA